MAKHMRSEPITGHVVRIARVMDVWVPEGDPEAAESIGRALADHKDELVAHGMNKAMADCKDVYISMQAHRTSDFHRRRFDFGLSYSDVKRLREDYL